MKLLSIIVPVYNKGEYIDECVDSILFQTLTDFELILVDDGSTDNSGEKCDALGKRDSRVIVIHQENLGVSSARNAGLGIASGKYIGFVDSDDILELGMYELLIHNIEKYQADISICGVKRVSPGKTQMYGGHDIVKFYNRDEGVTGLFKGEILLSNYEKIYRRATVKHIKFQPALFEDTFYNFEALMASSLVVHEDKILYNYMIRDNSHSLAAFNSKYMNALKLSRKMVDICLNQMPKHISQAKSFDFNFNMIVLNMILIDSRKNNINEYEIVSNNLKQYSTTYLSLGNINMRYRFGYTLFRISPYAYTTILKLYSIITNSEHLTRKRKLKSAKSELIEHT